MNADESVADRHLRSSAVPHMQIPENIWPGTYAANLTKRGLKMLTVNVPDRLTDKINGFARIVCQTPEEYLIELIEERIEHDSTYNETAYLAKSEINRKRLDRAVKDIRAGKYEVHGLINEND